jgi:hypothetical protein
MPAQRQAQPLDAGGLHQPDLCDHLIGWVPRQVLVDSVLPGGNGQGLGSCACPVGGRQQWQNERDQEAG